MGIVGELDRKLVDKYGHRASMFTEYPHPHFWREAPDEALYKHYLKSIFESDPNTPLHLYTHITQCHTQCLFCTCHVEITLDYEVVKSYLDILFLEIDLLSRFFEDNHIIPNFQEIHLGGGSPTYLKEEEFDRLVEKFSLIVDMDRLAEFSIEIDPRRVKQDKMRYYHDKGINRISIGVQDFDLTVQEAVNRVQPAKLTESLMQPGIRKLFSNGVNFDIICGLPRQTRESIRKTIKKVVEMSPDRVCLNYMHMSPFAPHQKLMPQKDIPGMYEKKILFFEALEILLEGGYLRTGYDHFVKPTDSVAKAMNSGSMQWNRLGVTPGRYLDIIGVGVSSTSTFGSGPDFYSQNLFERDLFKKSLEDGRFPVYRCHNMSRDDKIRRDVVQTIRNYFTLWFDKIEKKHGINFKEYFRSELDILGEDFVQDGLIILSDECITITELGYQFTDYICSKFDAYNRIVEFPSLKK